MISLVFPTSQEPTASLHNCEPLLRNQDVRQDDERLPLRSKRSRLSRDGRLLGR